MKRLLIALIAAGFASATVAMAADEKPYTAKPGMEKPGRAADDTVKSGADLPPKPGRAADEGTTTGKKKHKKKKAVEPKQ